MSPSRLILLETWISLRFQPWVLKSQRRRFLMQTWTSGIFQQWVLMSTSRVILFETGHLAEFNQGSLCRQVVEFCWRQDIWQISSMGLDISKSRNTVGDMRSCRFKTWVLISSSQGIPLSNWTSCRFQQGSLCLQAEEFCWRLGHLT